MDECEWEEDEEVIEVVNSGVSAFWTDREQTTNSCTYASL